MFPEKQDVSDKSHSSAVQAKCCTYMQSVSTFIGVLSEMDWRTPDIFHVFRGICNWVKSKLGLDHSGMFKDTSAKVNLKKFGPKF